MTVLASENRHWALFADWCVAVDRSSLPAAPDTLTAFLAELPAGPATVLRRVHAIDAAHRAAGMTPPGAAPVFDTLLRPSRPARFEPALVAAALDIIPIGGWPTGIVGRRDAALIALICTAGLTRHQVQALRYGPEPLATQSPPGIRDTTTGDHAGAVMATTPDPGTCPACALTRWLRVAALTETVGWRVVRNELADIGECPAGTETTHDCTRPAPRTPPADRDRLPGAGSSLFPAIDRHGVPQPTFPLSTRSITTIIATRLAAPTSIDEWGNPHAARSDATGRSWGEADRARVRTERKKAMDRLASYETILDQADAYAEAILQRLHAKIGEGADSIDPDNQTSC